MCRETRDEGSGKWRWGEALSQKKQTFCVLMRWPVKGRRSWGKPQTQSLFNRPNGEMSPLEASGDGKGQTSCMSLW